MADLRWLRKKDIKNKVNTLLKDYSSDLDDVITEVVPLEKIAEFHLGLYFDYDEPQNLDLNSEVLGAIYPDGRIFLNSKMNKPEFSKGRLRFTIGHEIGHWILHKDILNGNKEYASSLFRENSIINQDEGRTILCRENDKSDAEWQANKFAALLLMPPHLFVPRYKKLLNKFVSNNKNDFASLNSKISFELANIFNTSIEATRIHIEELNLNPNQLSLF